MARGKDVARSPSPVASSSFQEDDDVPSVHDSGDEDVKVEQEQQHEEEEEVGVGLWSLQVITNAFPMESSVFCVGYTSWHGSVWRIHGVGVYVGGLRRLSRFARWERHGIHQQGGVGGGRTVGKSSSHYNAQHIAFIGHSSNNDRIHRFYMQNFYRCLEGYENRAASVAHRACFKLVKDMHYEAWSRPL